MYYRYLYIRIFSNQLNATHIFLVIVLRNLCKLFPIGHHRMIIVYSFNIKIIIIYLFIFYFCTTYKILKLTLVVQLMKMTKVTLLLVTLTPPNTLMTLHLR